MSLRQRLAQGLLLARIGVFFVFFPWTLIKLTNPAFGMGITTRHYKMPFINETMITAFGVFEIIICLLFIAGLFKRATRAFFLVISLASIMTPRVLGGYQKLLAGPDSEPMIFLIPGFCMLACAMAVYVLRDYDTLWSLSKSDKSRPA